MAVALANRADIELHVFHDERSAAFAALGIGKASKVPAILLCTSGTAAVEFYAAVVEADHALVPILVCTADRPPELQNVGAPQTINQKNLYGDSVRSFVDAPVAENHEKNQWRSVARDAFHASLGKNLVKTHGPVHINLQFREPLIAVACGRNENIPPPQLSISTILRSISRVMQLIIAFESCRKARSPIKRIVVDFEETSVSL